MSGDTIIVEKGDFDVEITIQDSEGEAGGYMTVPIEQVSELITKLQEVMTNLPPEPTEPTDARRIGRLEKDAEGKLRFVPD